METFHIQMFLLALFFLFTTGSLGVASSIHHRLATRLDPYVLDRYIHLLKLLSTKLILSSCITNFEGVHYIHFLKYFAQKCLQPRFIMYNNKSNFIRESRQVENLWYAFKVMQGSPTQDDSFRSICWFIFQGDTVPLLSYELWSPAP